jgi:hypothetical protein
MTWDEYNKLFHKLQLNLVAFKPLMECDAEVLKLVNAAIEQEREACAKVCESTGPDAGSVYCAFAIRARK